MQHICLQVILWKTNLDKLSVSQKKPKKISSKDFPGLIILYDLLILKLLIKSTFPQLCPKDTNV